MSTTFIINPPGKQYNVKRELTAELKAAREQRIKTDEMNQRRKLDKSTKEVWE